MSSFPSIRIEGGLLGPELLDQAITADIPGQKPADFGLDPKRNLTDEIAGAFADSRALWGVFQNRLARLPEDDLATTVTRDAWVIPFLGLLGYELTYNPRAHEVDGMSFAVSHGAGSPQRPPSPPSGERAGVRGQPSLSTLDSQPSTSPDAPPVHIVGARQELGRVPPSGRPRMAPHSLVQEYLNRTEHVWGVVTNGLTLRLLRDSTLVRRQAYIEFDLQAILEEQRFHDFATLYRLLHRTRLPRGMADANECLLERYYAQTIEQGGRVREHLRDGVEECLKLLGNGFLAHPANEELRQKLKSNQLTPAQFYRQLFRLVYRFLFLLVSEDRGLISPDSVYRDHYGIARLRRMLDVQAAWTDHPDLWLSLRTLFRLFQDDKLSSVLTLAPLNGELFATQTLDGCTLCNRDLLAAFWYLAYYQEKPGAPSRRVNYAALDVEELGSVYESLLEFHPDISELPAPGAQLPALHFDLIFGSERKTTGSFYTPPELVNELVESALMPVVRQRIEGVKRMANGEWRMVEEPFRAAFWNYANQRLSRPGGLAEGTLSGQSNVSAHQAISQGGTVRHDLTNPSGGNVHSGQHSGGMGAALHGGVHPVSAQGQRQPDGTGNSSDDLLGCGTLPGGSSPAAADGTANPGQTTPGTGTKSGEEASGEQRIANGGAVPFATRHSPLTDDQVARLWRSTPFAIRHSLLAAQALLALKIIDVACGSGHMLLAAARRVGKELAKLRTGEDEPAPERVRESIRDVISHCVYGVDRNPLAVDLCRVALWLESHTAGKPLTFLDHRIRCGDSLVGVFDLAVLKNGIPDKAFDACEGDDKTVARSATKRNKEEKRGTQDLFAVRDDSATDVLSRHSRDVDAIPDDSPELIHRKKELFEASHRDPAWLRQKQACDLWTAAFFQTLAANSVVISSAALADHLGGRPIDSRLHANAGTLAHRQLFFHWPLEFPEVFAAGGFDVVLSNPPWERIKLQEQEFFAARDPRIATAVNKAARKKLIDELPQKNPALHTEFTAAVHAAECLSKFLRQSERYPLTATGDINTYAVFTEAISRLLHAQGRAAVIVPTGIATDDMCKEFFGSLVRGGRLAGISSFENEAFIFPAVHNAYKFCALFFTGVGVSISEADFVFFIRHFPQLRDKRRWFKLNTADFALLNPNTATCPTFRAGVDSDLCRKIYSRVPVWVREGNGDGNPWGVRVTRVFDMNKSEVLAECVHGDCPPATDRYFPMYEAKLIHQFDHRFANYAGATQAQINKGTLPQTGPEQKRETSFRVTPRYWVRERALLNRLVPPTSEEQRAIQAGELTVEELHELQQKRAPRWLIGYRDITNAVNERTSIASLFPFIGTDFTIRLVRLDKPTDLVFALLANLNSMVFDYVARQKLSGMHLSDYITFQLPVLPPSFYRAADVAYVGTRVLELVYTADDMQPLADALRAAASPLAATVPRAPYRWDEARRALLRAELDAWYARAYGLTRDELRYILDPADVHGPDFPGETFRVLKEKETAKFGEYRTRRLVLEAWDKLPNSFQVGNLSAPQRPRPDVQGILQEAEKWVEQKRRQGWTQKDFARGLKKFLQTGESE